MFIISVIVATAAVIVATAAVIVAVAVTMMPLTLVLFLQLLMWLLYYFCGYN